MKNKNILSILIITGLTFITLSCSNSESKKQDKSQTPTPELSEKPLRQAYEGFEWEKVSGAGIELWAQKSKNIQIGISETLPGAFVERIENGKPVATDLVIQIFELKNQRIEDVLDDLKGYEKWNEEEKCAFSKIESGRPDVDRYILMPTGKALKEYEARSSQEPICSTCGEFGSGNSGVRYFEIHHSNKNKALFIDIGQEEPLFDEKTIIVK